MRREARTVAFSRPSLLMLGEGESIGANGLRVQVSTSVDTRLVAGGTRHHIITCNAMRK